MVGAFTHSTRRHDIHFSASGRIELSASVVKQLMIAPGDVIDVCRYNGDLCLYVRYRNPNGRHTARCSYTKRTSRSRHARCWSVRLARAVIDAVRPDAKSIRLCCADPILLDDHILLPMITRMPL